MRACLAIAAVLFVPTFSYAQGAGKPCEELKSEIAKKLDDKGVKGYSLEVVAKDQDAAGKVVGTCEGGSKKIVYGKTAATPVAAPAAAPAPAPAKESSNQ